MATQSLRSLLHPDHAEIKKYLRPFLFSILTLIGVCTMVLWSCTEEGILIDRPDEFTQVYEANEKFVLRAIAQIFKDNALGKATINKDTHEVTSDYIVQGEWRTRSLARVRKVNQRESEVTLSVITEKKTPTGWEMRRLLGKEQYDRLFNDILFQIYRELYKLD
jgi:hypothetical protein